MADDVFRLPLPPTLRAAPARYYPTAFGAFGLPTPSTSSVPPATYRMRGLGAGGFVQWDEVGSPGTGGAPEAVTDVVVLRISTC